MDKLANTATDPNYDAAASSASKATIAIFMATFAYLVLFSGVSPGFLRGSAFFFVGIFAVSILIAAPLFLLRTKLPLLGPLVLIADVAITVFATRAAYLWLFAAPVTAASPLSVPGEPFLVKCHEPLPEFTLGANSDPSDEDVAQLCTCIWNSLGSWEQEAARAFSTGKESEVSSLHKRAFPSRFGSALDECGGRKL